MSKPHRSLRLPQVEEKVGLKKSAILDAVNRGEFPAPFKLLPNGRAVAWSEAEIDEYLAERMAARE